MTEVLFARKSDVDTNTANIAANTSSIASMLTRINATVGVVGVGKVLVGQVSGDFLPKTMSGGATIDANGVVTLAGGGGTPANPTAKVGRTAVNGSAATFLRSDGSPPLDETASFVFTGNIQINPTSGNALTIAPAAASLGLALNVSQSGPTTGGSGAQFNFNYLHITAEALAQSDASDFNGGFGLNVTYEFGGGNLLGGRTAIMGLAVLNSASNSGGSNLTRDRVGVTGWAQANSADGGTNTGAGAKGAFFGMNAVAIANNNTALNLLALVGIEVDTILTTGSTARFRWGFSAPSNGSVNGADTTGAADTAFIVYRSGAVSWKQGITFANPLGGGQPIDAAGTVIGTDNSIGSLTALAGIDFRGFTFTGNFITGPASAFSVSNAGATTGLSFNATAGTSAFKIGGTIVLQTNGDYTQLNDPSGSAKFFFGHTDNTAYVRSATILFQNAAGSINYVLINPGGLTVSDGTNITTVSSAGPVNIFTNLAIPAGGSAGKGITFSSATNFGIFFGSGAPTLSAAQGSIYLRSDGSTTLTRLYVNTTGSTTWTNFTSAA